MKAKRGDHLRQALADQEARTVPAPKRGTSASWWIGLSREEFDTEAAKRHPDIQNSTEGRKFPRQWRDA